MAVSLAAAKAPTIFGCQWNGSCVYVYVCVCADVCSCARVGFQENFKVVLFRAAAFGGALCRQQFISHLLECVCEAPLQNEHGTRQYVCIKASHGRDCQSKWEGEGV